MAQTKNIILNNHILRIKNCHLSNNKHLGLAKQIGASKANQVRKIILFHVIAPTNSNNLFANFKHLRSFSGLSFDGSHIRSQKNMFLNDKMLNKLIFNRSFSITSNSALPYPNSWHKKNQLPVDLTSSKKKYFGNWSLFKPYKTKKLYRTLKRSIYRPDINITIKYLTSSKKLVATRHLNHVLNKSYVMIPQINHYKILANRRKSVSHKRYQTIHVPVSKQSNIKHTHHKNNISATQKTKKAESNSHLISGQVGTSKYVLVDNNLHFSSGTLSKNIPRNVKHIKATKLSFHDVTLPTDADNLFSHFKYIKQINTHGLISQHTTSMKNLFANNSSLQSINLDNFQLTNTQNIDGMLSNNPNLTNVYLKNFNTTNVYSMNKLFANDSQLIHLNLKDLDMLKAFQRHNANKLFQDDRHLARLDLSPHDRFSSNAGLASTWYLTNVYSAGTNLMDGQQHLGCWQKSPLYVKTMLSYNDGVVNLALGSKTGVEGLVFKVGKHPNGLPSGYKVVDPNQEIILNDEVQNVQIMRKISNNSTSAVNSQTPLTSTHGITKSSPQFQAYQNIYNSHSKTNNMKHENKNVSSHIHFGQSMSTAPQNRKSANTTSTRYSNTNSSQEASSTSNQNTKSSNATQISSSKSSSIKSSASESNYSNSASSSANKAVSQSSNEIITF